MSVKLVPVTWNRNKVIYDVIVIAGIIAYVWVYLRIAPEFQSVTRPLDGAVLRMQAFGSCAFILLSIILAIGPLARLDPRFLPLLYNRRHLGVLTCVVAGVHISYVLGWYFAFSPVDRYEAVLSTNTAFFQLYGFPFEIFGVFAFLILLIMAATSHDFWLSFLTPPVWKGLHMLVYAAFAAVVLHVSLGRLQTGAPTIMLAVTTLAVAAVCGLHLAAALVERARARRMQVAADGGWLNAGRVADIPDGRAKILVPEDSERIAVFRHGRKICAVTNVCAHQNGPLGEGRIVDGCITCPWHGFQYDPETGCAPPPFTEKIATYNVKLNGDEVLVDPAANPPGTRVAAVLIPKEVA
jgi:nitrite reductase/ring-hydroxylating ferredoxin subunit/DMSO/TMAO reductase YedYZ heme-binding membrane subunit